MFDCVSKLYKIPALIINTVFFTYTTCRPLHMCREINRTESTLCSSRADCPSGFYLKRETNKKKISKQFDLKSRLSDKLHAVKRNYYYHCCNDEGIKKKTINFILHYTLFCIAAIFHDIYLITCVVKLNYTSKSIFVVFFQIHYVICAFVGNSLVRSD